MNITITRWCALIGILLSTSGCKGDKAFAALADGKSTYWELRLNYHAVRLSLHPPYNSLKLETTAYTSTGDVWVPLNISEIDAGAIPQVTRVDFVSRDSTLVAVAPDGTVTARGAIQGTDVYVVARRTMGGITHTDSALVQVADVAVPPVLTTLRVRPAATDSAKIAVRFGYPIPNIKALNVTMLDANNTVMSGYPVYLASSNVSVASVTYLNVPNRFAVAKQVMAVRPGEVLIRSETWVYGVAKADSFTFTVGYPILADVTPFRIGPTGSLVSDRFDIGPGGHVAWENFTGRTTRDAGVGGVAANGQPVDVIFEDTTNILASTIAGLDTGSGNIMGIQGDTALPLASRMRMRRFLVPGTYSFKVMPFGVIGKVVVHDK